MSPSPTSAEPMSPVDIENRLRQSITDLTQAQEQLRDARDVETDAELGYLSAYRRVLLSADCPPVRRDGYTAAERDAWVSDQVAEDYTQYRHANARRKAAEDRMRTLRDVASNVQSLGAMVRSAYQLAGVE